MPDDMLIADRAPTRVWGQGNARRVLALHCSLAHAGAWSALAKALPELEITAFDQPGHGRAAPWNGTDDLHDLTTGLALALAQDLAQSGPIDLFGHSFGGTVALRIALERPDLVRSLVLVEPVIFAAARVAGHPAYAPFAAGHLDLARLIAAGRQGEAAERFHAAWGGDATLADLSAPQRDYIIDRMHIIAGQNAALLDDSAALLAPLRLESLDRPVLLVEGAASPPVIDAVMTELARRLPRSERLKVPGAGHMVSITHPSPVAEAIRSHLAAS